MSFNPTRAEIRFGYGLSPRIAPPSGVSAMIDGLSGPDEVALACPVEDYPAFRSRLAVYREAFRTMRDLRGKEGQEAAREARRDLIREARRASDGWAMAALARCATTPTGFRERLVGFWADHFTARGRFGVLRFATAPYVEEAIRPHVGGRFEDLLAAAVLHPLMLHYLDQDRSFGPSSRQARRSDKPRGLNENLAREVLELHTLGVEGPYAQADVRELAELLTGLDHTPDKGLVFRRNRAEPGAETVLGRTYDGEGLKPIRAALRDLARHPATARHIARKLAVHFVSDAPDPDLVRHLEARFLDTGGDLPQLCAALLEHPAAWTAQPANVKRPAEFVASSCRALSIPARDLMALKPKQARTLFLEPMRRMGQPWLRPEGPEGWSESDAAWLTPQGLAARLDWAMRVPRQLAGDLPDPREFVLGALGQEAPDAVRFAAAAAETRADGIGLVLGSPAFQRQ